MPSTTKSHGAKGPQIPENTSRNAVSPIMRDGVNKIVTKLSEIEGTMGDLGAPDTAHTPDMGDLLQDVLELQHEVNGLKLAQDAQIKDVRDAATNDVKKDIAKMLKGEIAVIITKTVATQVEEEMAEWGNNPRVSNLVNRLERMTKKNNTLLENGHIQLENSRSRHANSTIDIQDDFNRPLAQIKYKDGHVSELFPISLRDLFLYEGAKLVRLLEEYGLRPLEKDSQNLNRFLIFIGVNVSVPDQLVDPTVEEQPPAYLLRDAADLTDERNQRSTRRRSSASEKNANGPWYNIFS